MVLDERTGLHPIGRAPFFCLKTFIVWNEKRFERLVDKSVDFYF